MTGVVLGIVAAFLLAATGFSVAATLRLRSILEVVLGAYVVAFATAVLLALALTPFEGMSRAALLLLAALVAALSTALWLRAGRPTPEARALRERMREAAWSTAANRVLVLATAAAGAYAAALIVGTPPNSWDSLWYHLARAAFWVQERSIGYVTPQFDHSLNVPPPNGEIVLALVLEVTRLERAAGFLQLAAWGVSAISIYLLARKLGLRRSEAFAGSALFALLPVVILQASTTLNDLVTASLLLAATVFLIGSRPQEQCLAAIALALAIGTKFSAPFAVPVLFLIALMAEPHTHRVRRITALLAGCVVGSYWYVVNFLNTGTPLGHDPGGLAHFGFTSRFLGALARILDTFEVTGVRDWGGYAYPVLAALSALLLIIVAWLKRDPLLPALVTGALLFAPLAIFPASYLAWRVYAKLQYLLSPSEQGYLPLGWEVHTAPSEGSAWYGPIGFGLVASFALVTPMLVRRRALPVMAVGLALSPVVYLILVSAIAYDPWQGRYFMYPVALSATLWGIVLRRSPVALACALVAVLIAGLTLAQYDEKPGYVWGRGSVWTKERWEVQSLLRPEVRSVLEFIEKDVPPEDIVALALSTGDWSYPAFGPRLSRRVLLVPFGSSASEIEADWLVANRQRSHDIDRDCWRAVLVSRGGTIFSRHPTC
jgi:hypothetical protein